MVVTDIQDAQRLFSKLIERVSAGEEITIAKAGKPVAKLVPYTEALNPRRRPGAWKGKVWISRDFDKPDAELEGLFYGSPIEPAP